MDFAFLLTLIYVLCRATATSEAPVAQTPYGSVRGYVENGPDWGRTGPTRVWRGIPYASPPVGDLRFRPPQPPRKWEDVLNTTEYRASCVQWGSPGYSSGGPAWNSLNLTNSSEDCLYLNVYVPDAATTPLPVMVWINAGEFRFGSSNDLENTWPHFANGSVIVVTANSRIGLVGFAALDVLRSRDPSRSTGNYGMQDQRAALKWVKESISSFGGNASQITVFGESSGGSSVAFHLTSNASKGLFSQVIMESPGLTQSKSWVHSVENTQYAVSALTAAGSGGCTWPDEVEWIDWPGIETTGEPLGLVPKSQGLEECSKRPECFLIYNRDGAVNSTLFGGGRPGGMEFSLKYFHNLTFEAGYNPGVETIMKLPNLQTATRCLVSANLSDLIALDIMPPHSDTFQTDAVAPTVDGVELAAPLERVSTSAVPSGIPILAGSNLDEGTEFMYLVPPIPCNATEPEFRKWSLKMFGPVVGAQVPPLYEDVEEPAPLCPSRTGENTSTFWQAAMRSAGDNAILCRTRELLRAAERQGSKTWWYYFTHTPNRSVNMGDLRYEGAFHGAEVPFVWGDDFEITGDAEAALSKAMGCYWINFAATGNPNKGPSGCAAALSLAEWPAFGPGDALEFSVHALQKRPLLKQPQCDMFVRIEHSDAKLRIKSDVDLII